MSGPESPASPRTAAEEHSQQLNISLLTEDVEEMQDYDGDDVAYRLRLLVNNNYFLPPAHMKPSPEDFAATMNAKKPPKPSAPTFLDIFRVGKSKSKPTTPTATGFGQGPQLRTTSDTISAPYALRTQPRAPQTSHSPGLPMKGIVDRGRVVVVRERMNDIAVAAKQAEQEMKTRNARRESGAGEGGRPPVLQSQEAGDVIDPTDAVDVPLPAPNYPFAVQASALHGLGVQESVGAALLADRLPPHSPNMSLSYEVANDWRKALLQEAVHHSLDNTPDESTFSHVAGTSTPMLASPRVNGQSSSRSTTPGTRAKRLQQRIAEPQTSLEVEKPSQEIVKKSSIRKSQQSRPSTSKSASKFLATPDSHDSRRSSYLPARAVTPIGNLTPLSPAPRNRLFGAVYSASQVDFHQQQNVDAETPASSTSPKSRLRRSMSTPMLSETYEAMRQQFVMTPPPPPLPSTRRSSQMTQMSAMTLSYETSRDRPSRSSTFSSHSHFDEHDIRILGRSLRGSPRLSALGNRPSVSSFSQASLSPTTSAFQDALNHSGSHSATSSIHRRSSFDREEGTRTRSSIASPPPRPSTSIAHIALRPPPRSSSFNHAISNLNQAMTADPRIQVTGPSPIKGGFPHPSSSRPVNTIPLTLEIPHATSGVAIHSPAPSSPTSFFDTIQAQPNAMDDLDSSDESEEDEDEEEADAATQKPIPLPRSPPAFILDPRARANSTVSMSPTGRPTGFMRLGNFSTPYVGRGAYERSRILPIGIVDSKKPLGYTPVKAPFFSERKSDLGHGSELTTLLAQAQGREMNPLTEASTSAGGAVAIANSPGASTDPNVEGEERRQPMTASQIMALSRLPNERKPESLKKLDGMLVQHMEAEKDRIKKIAGAIKSSSQVNLAGNFGGSGSGQQLS